jgi:putative colanic acid biosynthesis UDP-glucose lipid carrier transferase
VTALPRDIEGLRKATPPRERGVRWSPQFVRLLTGAIDLIVLSGTGLVVFWARFGTWDLKGLYGLAFVLMILVSLNVFNLNGLYQFEPAVGFYSRFRAIVRSWAVIVLLMLALAFATKTGAYFSRIWFFSWCIAAFSAQLIAQTAWLYVIRHSRLAERLRETVLVVGTPELAGAVLEHIRGPGSSSLDIAGIVAVGRPSAWGRGISSAPLLGTAEDLTRLARDNAPDRIILAVPWTDGGAIRDCLDSVRSLAVNVELAMPPLGPHLPSQEPTLIAGLPAVRLLKKPLSGTSRAVKTIEDYLLASLALIVAAPVLLLVAALIKLESPGPVFFRQRRAGFENQDFLMFKFRTMRHDPGGAFRQATPGDPRITRVGRVLRRTSIDELPQLINVLRGEMSLVGPRPHAVSMNRDYAARIDEYLARHKIKPGMTGWAQVNGARGETRTLDDMRRRVAFDLEYANNWSIWFDLRILALTLIAVLRQVNAY